MRRRRAARGERGGAEVAVGGTIDLHRLIEPFHEQGVRFVLVPLDAALLAIDADVQIILLTDADLRTVEHAFRAAFETQQHVGVVIQLAAFDEAGEVRGEFGNFEAGDVLREVFRVRADVAHAAARAAALRVRAPGRLLLSTLLQARGQPALGILDDDLADLAELAGGDHGARFLHERIAGVVVRQAVKLAGLFHQRRELLGFGEIECRRLVAQDVKAILQRHLRRRKVHVIRRHDGDEIHPLVRRQRLLRFDHFLISAVAAPRRQKEVRTARPRFFRVR